MSPLRVALDEILPVKEASRSLPRALERIESREADHLVITRRSKPAAVLIAVDRYEELLRVASAAGL
jgi:prevent-host-death family protein